MSWTDNLQSASFRGIPFKVADTDTSVGRRNVLHQYPFKDIPYVEDLGADADEFSLNAYIIQSVENSFDYFAERDALLTALKEAGSGTLVHPFLGEVTVAVFGKARLTESFQEGGIARFSITFIQAGENKFPQSPQDTVGAIDKSVEESLNIILDSFGIKYSQVGMPGFSTTQGVNDITSAFNMMKSSAVAIKGAVASTVSKALAIIDESKGLLTSVISTPCSLGTNMLNSYDSYFTIVGLVGDTFTQTSSGLCSGREIQRFASSTKIDNILGTSCIKAMVSVNRFGELPDIIGSSPYGGQIEEIPVDNYIRAQEKANRISYKNVIRASTLLKATQIASRVDYYSFEDAFNSMELITGAIENLLLDMGNVVENEIFTDFGLSIYDEDSYNALKETKSIFIKSMKLIGASFANIIEYELEETDTTLSLAYDLYEDVDRAEDIFTRNRPTVKHPGFLPGGQTVEVLNE